MMIRFCLIIYMFIKLGVLLQTDYRINVEKAELEFVNSSYLQNLTYSFHFPSRRNKILFVSGRVLQDVDEDVTTVVEAYKLLSNQYRGFPFLYKCDACKVWTKNDFDANYGSYDTNMTLCPIKKGFYYANYRAINVSQFPPYAPRGHFKLNMKLFHKKTIKVTSVNLYVEIQPTDATERVI